MQNELHLNYLVLCHKLISRDGMTSLVGIFESFSCKVTDTPNITFDLAFCFTFFDPERHYVIDFKVEAPDGKEYYLDRCPVGLIKNSIVYVDKITFPYIFKDAGLYKFRAYLKDRILGETFVRFWYKTD